MPGMAEEPLAPVFPLTDKAYEHDIFMPVAIESPGMLTGIAEDPATGEHGVSMVMPLYGADSAQGVIRALFSPQGARDVAQDIIKAADAAEELEKESAGE